MKRIFCAVLSLSVFLACALVSGCSKENNSTEKTLSYQARNAGRSNRIVIWTSCREFAEYVELFNKGHKSDSAVIVYKENPALSLPPAIDEEIPDIIVGSWLRTEKIPSDFKSLDYIFDYQKLSYDIFYPQLLETGRYFNSQYLLPVSYNLPTIIFASENADLVDSDYILDMNQIREVGAAFNKKNRKGNFTRIGFTPLGNEDFLYEVLKLNCVNFRLNEGSITWNADNLTDTQNFLRDWVITENGSPKTEEDFTFKYLFMPDYRRVTSERTLFAFATSDRLFKILKDQPLKIDYRWLTSTVKTEDPISTEENEAAAEQAEIKSESSDSEAIQDESIDTENEEAFVEEPAPVVQKGFIPIEDSFVMLGIYRYAENVVGATEFITWFFQSESQKEMLDRKTDFKLETEQFGIAGGFSAVEDVTEHILPLYYTALLSNLPPSNMISVPQILPPRWESYLSLVVKPYIHDAIAADEDSFDQETGEYIPSQTIQNLETEWRKKVFD